MQQRQFLRLASVVVIRLALASVLPEEAGPSGREDRRVVTGSC
jgi:hypothetical protein